MGKTKYALVLIIGLIATPAVSAPDCAMTKSFTFGQRVSVLADAAGKSLFFASDLKTNTDGAKRSYSVTDFWGRDNALNNLCNAMSDACAGLDQDGLRARRIMTQNARASGWPPAALKATRLSADIVPFKDGKPCPEVDGFTVSATALENQHVADVCDLSRYVDAVKTPALVVPKGANGFSGKGVSIGDLVVAMSPNSAPVFAIVGDLGPSNGLGEGSVALAAKLLGKTAEPANFVEIKKSWQVPKVFVVVFPGTHDPSDRFSMIARLDQAAQAAFDQWGGADRLKACAAGQH